MRKTQETITIDYSAVETPAISKTFRKIAPTCIDCQPNMLSNAAIQKVPEL
jgi:hypothetical protein